MNKSVRRVVVGVDGSVGSLAALRRAVDEARLRDAALQAVIAWEAPGGDSVRGMACPPSLVRFWQDEAATRLTTAWDEAMGGVPTDLDVRLLAVRGKPVDALLHVADQEGDLLVVGAAARGWWRRLVTGASVARHCTVLANCAVLIVPAPALARGLRHGGGRRLVRELVGDRVTAPTR